MAAMAPCRIRALALSVFCKSRFSFAVVFCVCMPESGGNQYYYYLSSEITRNVWWALAHSVVHAGYIY